MRRFNVPVLMPNSVDAAGVRFHVIGTHKDWVWVEPAHPTSRLNQLCDVSSKGGVSQTGQWACLMLTHYIERLDISRRTFPPYVVLTEALDSIRHGVVIRCS